MRYTPANSGALGANMRNDLRIRHCDFGPSSSGEGCLGSQRPRWSGYLVNRFFAFLFIALFTTFFAFTPSLAQQVTSTTVSHSDKTMLRVAARDSSLVNYVGRIAFNPTGDALLSWSGTSATLRFEGTACRAIFKSRGGLYRIFVNGQPAEAPIRTAPSDTVLWLAKDLPYGVHTVTIFKRTEPAIGTGVFSGFEILGQALPKPAPMSRRIEFIGGSSLNGFGVLDTATPATYSPQNQDHSLSYAANTAKRLNATSHVVAWSGMGLSRNAAGDSGTTMPALWQKVDPTRPLAYDFRFRPEAVVIDLAVHDFAITPLPDSARYVYCLRSFVDAVRVQYPAAHIVLVAGTTLSDSVQALSRAIRYHEDVANSYGGKVSTLRFTPLPTGNGLSTSGWPNAAQHAHNADELVAHLSQVMAWPGVGLLQAPPLQRQFGKAQPTNMSKSVLSLSAQSQILFPGRRILLNGRVLPQ